MVGLHEHVFHRLLVAGPAGEVAPVFVGQLPALERTAFASVETSPLLLLGDVEPKLDENRALGGEGGLPAHDLGVGPPPLLFQLDELIRPAHELRLPSRCGHGT